jgi:hypothetical protein
MPVLPEVWQGLQTDTDKIQYFDKVHSTTLVMARAMLSAGQVFYSTAVAQLRCTQ